MAAHKSRTNVKIILAGTTLFLLVAASLLGFSSVMSAAAASLSIDDTNSTTAAEDNGSTAATISDDVSLTTTTTTTTTTMSTIQLAVEPFAIGQYAILSENMISQTETQLSFEGNTTIISPNTTETIMARDTGEVIFSLLPAHDSGVIRGQFHMTTEDGSESATADFTEFVRFESPTAIGIAYFSTNSTGGMLAPLNNMIAVFLDEEQPNQNATVRFFEWKSEDGGAPIGSGNNSTPIATS